MAKLESLPVMIADTPLDSPTTGAYVVFVIQCFYPRDHWSAVVGAAVGAGLGVVLMVRKARHTRAEEAAAAAADED